MMNFKKILFTLLISFTGLWSIAGQVELTIVKGRVLDENGESLVGATVIVPGTNKGTTTNDMGKFILKNLPVGIHELKVSFIGYQTMIRTINLKDSKDAVLTVQLNPDEEELLDVEVFGERYRQPAKLDAITRMPLRPSEQIQSISVISNKLIEEQGVLTVNSK